MGLQLAEITIVGQEVDLQNGMAGVAKNLTSFAVVDRFVVEQIQNQENDL